MNSARRRWTSVGPSSVSGRSCGGQWSAERETQRLKLRLGDAGALQHSARLPLPPRSSSHHSTPSSSSAAATSPPSRRPQQRQRAVTNRRRCSPRRSRLLRPSRSTTGSLNAPPSSPPLSWRPLPHHGRPHAERLQHAPPSLRSSRCSPAAVTTAAATTADGRPSFRWRSHEPRAQQDVDTDAPALHEEQHGRRPDEQRAR